MEAGEQSRKTIVTDTYLKCRYRNGMFPQEYLIEFRQVPERRHSVDWMFVDRSCVIPGEKSDEGLAQIASVEDGGDCFIVGLYNMGDNSRRCVYKEDIVHIGNGCIPDA